MKKYEVEVTIAVSALKDRIPKEKSLKERIEFALRYAVEHERDLFFMSHEVTDELLLQSALSAVIVTGNAADKDIIERSLKPVRMLSAAMSGIPVDFSQLELGDDILPIVGMLKDAKNPIEAGAQ